MKIKTIVVIIDYINKMKKNKNMLLKDRFKESRLITGMTQSELAKKIGVSQTAINKIEIGSTSKPRNIVELAKHLNVSADWLLTGTQEITTTNIDPLEFTSIAVPLINWVQAGEWSDIASNYQADEYFPCPENHSANTFALTVCGESMYPDFINGEIIYVDPAIEPKNGSCVVAQQNNHSEATFKQLAIDGNNRYLKALNPQWPEQFIKMLPDAHICGVVIGSYRKRN